jgi:hypothetical protein
MISNYKCTFNSWEGKSTSVTQKPMPNQREQYGDIVHLFIGMGRSPRKITLMPLTFINNSMIILRGLIWFFIFKSVSFSAAIPKLFYTQLRLCANLRVLCASSYRGSDPSPKIPVNVLYSRNIVKSCFWGPSEAEGPQQPYYAMLTHPFTTSFFYWYHFHFLHMWRPASYLATCYVCPRERLVNFVSRCFRG